MPSGPVPWILTEESGEELESVPRVARFRLAGAYGFSTGDVWLVSGDVSSVSQGKLAAGEIPVTVEENRQPLTVWREGEDAILAPTSILENGERYSFVARGVGLLGAFSVSEEQRPILRLLGEPRSVASGDLFYCLDESSTGDWDLEVFDDGFGFSMGVSAAEAGSDSCVRTQFPEGREFFLPPSSIGEFLFEPVIVELSQDAPALPNGDPPRSCTSETTREFWGGCLESVPGAAIVHLSPGYFAISLRDKDARPVAERVVHATGEESHAFGPLESEMDYEFKVTSFVPGAPPLQRAAEELHVEGGAPAPRFVLTELLADPLGSEPQSEWVEVINVGTGAGSLAGLELWDSGDGVVLPDVTLDPGQVGLIVRRDFSFESDVVPNRESTPVVVESIGGNGLRNSGEEVSLRSSDGRTLSKIVPLPARAGESIARVDPWGADIPASFVARESPTPGTL